MKTFKDFENYVLNASYGQLVGLAIEGSKAVKSGNFNGCKFCYEYFRDISENPFNRQPGIMIVMDMCQIISFEIMKRVANGTFVEERG